MFDTNSIGVTIHGQLTIDDTAAELLNRISGHNQAEELARTLLPDVPALEVVRALNGIHVETAAVLKKRAAALRAIEQN